MVCERWGGTHLLYPIGKYVRAPVRLNVMGVHSVTAVPVRLADMRGCEASTVWLVGDNTLPLPRGSRDTKFGW